MNPRQQPVAAPRKSAVDPKVVRALGHPLRQQILLALGEKVMSPNQLSLRLGQPLTNVAYHMKILKQCEAVELAHTKPARGAIEHFYRPTMRAQIEQPEHWAQLPASVRNMLFDQTLQQIWDHAVEGASANGFDHPNTHVGWTALELDEEAYDEVTAILAETHDRVLEVQAASLGRVGQDGSAETVRTELAILHYQRAPKSPKT